MSKNFYIEFLLFFLILSSSLLFRLYKVDAPLADHHSWRQSDTAAVARNFVKEGWDFLQPKIDNMTFLHSPALPNSKRLFLVEPPLYQTMVAVLYRFLGVREVWARSVTIFFSLGSTIFLFLIAKRYFGSRVGLLTAFFFTVLPYSVFYSRVILPEPLMIFLTLGFIFFFLRWLEEDSMKWYLIALVFSSLALTQKLFPFFLILALGYVVLRRYSSRVVQQKEIWFFVLFSLIPIVAWRIWISNFPEGIPPSDWLLNQGDIRFKGAFFWWIFAERLGKLILGYWGLVPLGLGLILSPGKKEGWFFHLWFLGIVVYVTVFATGNVTHDYYQIPFVPIVSVFLAKGSDFLLWPGGQFVSRWITRSLFIVVLFFMLSFSWKEVRAFYALQGGVDLAGQAVDELVPPNALVLTGDTNDATLLYNTNRYGWTGGYASYFPNSPETIEKVKSMGASIYVTTKWNELKNQTFGFYLSQNYLALKETDQYIIFDLSKHK